MKDRKETTMSDDNLTAIRWIVYTSVFGASLWWLWNDNDYWIILLVSALLSLIGGGAVLVAVELAFNSDIAKTPLGKVFIFFSTLAVLYWLLWAGSGDYYSDLR